jgi:hypothetical protein
MADQNLAKRLQARIVAYSALGIFAVGVIVSVAGILPLTMQLRQAQIKSLQVDLRKKTERIEDFVNRSKSSSLTRATRGKLRGIMEALPAAKSTPPR